MDEELPLEELLKRAELVAEVRMRAKRWWESSGEPEYRYFSALGWQTVTTVRVRKEFL